MSEDESMVNIAINDLALRTLNRVPMSESESTAQAIDGLENMIRRGSLAIAMALLEVAAAIRESRET